MKLFPFFINCNQHTTRKWKWENHIKTKQEKELFLYMGGKESVKAPICNNGTRYPSSVQKFSNGNNGNVHPTQKPVPLLEYLIRTYTNEGETVLDFTMGSGSTGVACVNTGRNFIGIELDEKYFNIAKERIDKSTES